MKYANTPDDLLPIEKMLEVSGLELLQDIAEGRIAQPPIGKSLNFSLQEATDGSVRFRGAPLFEHTNPMGTTHGGWYGTIMDSCLACAVTTKIPVGSTSTTLEFKVNILRPIPLGMEVDAIGIADHVGRTTGVAHGTIRGVQDGKIYATGSTTCTVIKMA